MRSNWEWRQKFPTICIRWAIRRSIPREISTPASRVLADRRFPVSVYKIDTDYNVRPFVTDLMNATGLALDSAGFLYVSSRFNGTVYRISPSGAMSTYAQGMGVATGIAFDAEGNLYVGDRSGTIFKIARDRQIYVFATLEPSVSAYHLAFAVVRKPVRHRPHHLQLRRRLRN